MLNRNIRGIGIALCLLALLLSLSGCGSLKDDTLLTVNAAVGIFKSDWPFSIPKFLYK